MAKPIARTKSGLLDYLPAIYQDPGWAGSEPSGPDREEQERRRRFLGEFLAAFELLLLGREPEKIEVQRDGPFLSPARRATPKFQSLEEKIANLPALFDAWRSPSEFLEWLAGWAALILKPELGELQKRELIANIIPLYRIRGTPQYVERLLEIFLGGKAHVDDRAYPGMQIATYSTVATDTYLGGSAPHYFRVRIAVSAEERASIETRRRIAHEVIEQAKPAHTYYDLDLETPRFQVGVHSRIGADTFLVSGERPN
jgi:phage tail-like protein